MEKKTYRPYNPKQMMLLPPSLDEWLPQDHLARFIDESIDAMDISAISDHYERELRGYPPYHPRMMLKILIYGYCTGVRASRKLARKCVEDVAFRYLAANNFPDFRTISDFRQMHLAAFKELFLQVLVLCRAAGLTTLGHIALDGSKFKAHASKHKAMSYGRMKAEEERLKQEIEQLVAQAQRIDREEDLKYGKDKSGDEVPDELKRKEDRLKRIQEAKAALEEEAAKARGKDDSGDPPKPDDKTQRNFTDPESRIMPSSSDKGSFIQGYNGQIAVNEHQIIMANGLTASSADCPQLVPMTAKVRANAGGVPENFTADAGYFSNANVLFLREFLRINALIPPDKQKHGRLSKEPEVATDSTSVTNMMKVLLAMEDNRALYALRKVLVEPVFGQIKRCMGFTQFLVRGQAKASGEWDLVCLCHNLRKLFGSRMKPVGA
jgi:transposase